MSNGIMDRPMEAAYSVSMAAINPFRTIKHITMQVLQTPNTGIWWIKNAFGIEPTFDRGIHTAWKGQQQQKSRNGLSTLHTFGNRKSATPKWRRNT